MSDTNIESFEQAVKYKIHNVTQQIESESDTNKSYELLETLITNQFKENFPSKRTRFNKYKHKVQPWISNSIIRSIQKRDKLYIEIKNFPMIIQIMK